MNELTAIPAGFAAFLRSSNRLQFLTQARSFGCTECNSFRNLTTHTATMSEHDFRSLQGCFLTASEHLRDPNFYRSVVLMLEHSAEGAMGLVINRPSATSIGKALGGSDNVNDAGAPVFIGGPVEPTSLFILHNCARLAASDREVSPGIFLAGSEHSFETVVRTPLQEPGQQRFRLISGYSGWGPQQLEGEIARGDWHLQPADSTLILEDNPYGIWEVCRRRLRRMHRLLQTDVRNPEWN